MKAAFVRWKRNFFLIQLAFAKGSETMDLAMPLRFVVFARGVYAKKRAVGVLTLSAMISENTGSLAARVTCAAAF